MAEETTKQTEENGEEHGTKPGLDQEILEKERIDTADGFVWTVTIKIRDTKGRTSFGVGACNSNEAGGKMPENEVLGLARERAKENAVEEAALYYAPRQNKTGDEPPPTGEEIKTMKKIESFVGAKYGVPVTSRLDEESLRAICINNHDEKLAAECTIPEQGETYGMGSDGLIWIFHNRLLPVKFILRVIADQITESERQFIDYEDARESVRINAEYFTDSVREIDYDADADAARKGKRKTGFPHTGKTARLSPKLKKYVDRKTGEFKSGEGTKRRAAGKAELDRVISSSADRFIDQFLGRYDKKKLEARKKAIKNGEAPEPISFVGACFEMGLLLANDNLEVTLTQRGLDFTCQENPVFEKLRNPNSTDYSILSKEEVKFFMNEIVSQERFALERRVMKTILGRLVEKREGLKRERKEAVEKLKKPEDQLTADEREGLPSLISSLSVEEIVKVLEDKQTDRLKEKGVPVDEKLQGNLDGYRQTRAITTSSRLVEMGLLEKGSSPNETPGYPPKTSYELTELGEEIYEDILSKN